MPRYFLFGFIEVPMWDYYWGLTAAQVELLAIDQPIVVYKADKDKEKPWKDGTVSENYANRQYLKWLERKKQRELEGKSIDFEKTFSAGKKVDMGTFLNSNELPKTE